MSKMKIDMILHKNERGRFDLWACRGDGKGCKRNLTRNVRKPCENCLGPLPEHLTLQQVYDQLQKGDA